MTTTLDIAALVQAVALPLVLLVAIVTLREPIVAALNGYRLPGTQVDADA
ncbi:MAG: hypothetical protein M3406_14575 [Chloroflexota bacterium]|nr:hypothetical protein [Chloroflexota bacterium]